MRADSGALLDDADRNIAPSRTRELCETACRGEAGRSGTDDDDVEFHAIARQVLRIDRQAGKGAAL